MQLTDFDYTLPESLIANVPSQPRDAARLLVWPFDSTERTFADLPECLNAGDLIVFNDTRVIPARIFGARPKADEPGEVKVELLLHKPVDLEESIWQAFARPAKRLKEGNEILFADGVTAKVLSRQEDQATLHFNVTPDEFEEFLNTHGQMPLPPYIQRPEGATVEDIDDYQTVYAKDAGSVAAPTAGLHFTEALMMALKQKGVETAFVTLHVGAGTFMPVRVDNILEHKMHAEWGTVSPQVAAAVNAAHARGNKVIAVGTTSLRLLESAAAADGQLKPYAGETDIFIYPGYSFKVVDRLVTNFHLPKSTLLMLVAAFIGMDDMQALYTQAVNAKYKFYSYGDGCLLSCKR
ncbi:MAG: tRNA preQ1(34) S-adenosylmethionine ribosyltransferase-isomerase QueA [Proteobacteria bacterium]|nr:tRNA preQ1(34) S-adenosylmethionine ribosyltransferase-isomerase QueA [Pseudomonadota bacterium]